MSLNLNALLRLLEKVVFKVCTHHPLFRSLGYVGVEIPLRVHNVITHSTSFSVVRQ